MALQVSLAIRILLLGAKRYRAFLAYLIMLSAGDFYLLSLPLRSIRYTISWMIVQIVSVALMYASALEIYANLAQHFGGVDQRGRIVSYLRRILDTLMGLSLLASLGFAVFDARSRVNQEFFSLGTALSAAVLLKRIATSTLAVFLACSAMYFSRFRVTLQRNLWLHGMLFAAWMVVSAAALLWRNLEMRSVYVINIVFLSLSVSIFGVWTVALRKDGESIPVRLSVSEGRAQAEREILLSFLRRLTRQR